MSSASPPSGRRPIFKSFRGGVVNTDQIGISPCQQLLTAIQQNTFPCSGEICFALRWQFALMSCLRYGQWQRSNTFPPLSPERFIPVLITSGHYETRKGDDFTLILFRSDLNWTFLIFGLELGCINIIDLLLQNSLLFYRCPCVFASVDQ